MIARRRRVTRVDFAGTSQYPLPRFERASAVTGPAHGVVGGSWPSAARTGRQDRESVDTRSIEDPSKLFLPVVERSLTCR